MQGDGCRATKLVAQIERGLQQRLVQRVGQGSELLACDLVAPAQVLGMVGNETLACVTAATLSEVALGQVP